MNRRSAIFVVAGINFCIFLLLSLLPRSSSVFQSYYIAGYLARTARASLYNWQVQQEVLRQLLGDVKFLPFFHPPLELLVFAPLSLFSFQTALWIWRFVCVACACGSGVLLARTFQRDRATAIAIVAALGPAGYCFWMGQDSLLLLFIVSAAIYALKKENDVAAGVILSLALFKPQLPLLLAICFFIIGRRKATYAFVAAAGVVATLCALYMGPEGLRQMRESTRVAETTLPIATMPNLRGVVSLILGHNFSAWISVVLGALGFVPVALLWRRYANLEAALATAICAECLLAPHLFQYDLSLLAIPMVLVLDRVHRYEWLALAFLLPPLHLLLTTYHASALLVVGTLWLLVIAVRSARLFAEGHLQPSVPVETATPAS